jgi:hypothetical protein
VHLRDIARPLGLTADVPAGHWRILLDHLTGAHPVPGLAPHGRPAGVRLRATDLDWESGDGPLVTGPAEALAMAITGRAAALADLHGPGVARLQRGTG